MADVKWIKIVTDIFDDQKIRFIETMPNGDSIIVIWFKLMCLAGKSNSNGYLMMTDKIAYTDDILASIFSRDIKLIQLSLTTFEKLDMVEITDNKMCLLNWEKHQNAERLSELREQSRLSSAKCRSKQVLPSHTVTGMSRDCHGDDTDKDIDIDKDIEPPVVSNDTTAPKGARAFVPPTVEEVSDYCAERNNTVDPQTFVDFYTSKGWVVGKTKMKDWKAAVRTWERKRDGSRSEPQSTSNPFLRLLQEGAFDDDD